MKHEQDSREISQGRQTITRRSFLKIGCGAGAVLAATEAPFIGQERASATEIEGSKINRRQERAFQMRRNGLVPTFLSTLNRNSLMAMKNGTATSGQAWLACQRGRKPRAKLEYANSSRYICSNRELAEFVHRDFSFQAYMNAALIMLHFGEDALSPTNPYHGFKTQFGDITFGNKNILSMVAQADELGQKGAYYHKWLVHRRLRPEVFGGRLQSYFSERKSYDIQSDILRCDAVARVHA